ncbi:hypothetical protein GLI01_18700 [Gluconacetobacter liquefaciens]|uniref:Glyoxalase-like domain-containing protein n=1 Tax=Gluconacetobacter liquefaciens TaxID=89584 RepID=A0A370G2L8_GLULI|nr:hypothetical protein C7453_107135 [Gluconacetobacter liquefaciens]GBQ97975.1 hypothetical protein AA0522_1019 [Gluconacetobacter liquefaciens NRIC 0522]GEB37835.1 hypothetical protein GLI01_18700 [Gluconacetobacter liquefaciens]
MDTPPDCRISAIIPCNDIDAAERWWNRLGFFGPADGDGDYRILSNREGAAIHLQPAVPGWVVPGRNPFGVSSICPRPMSINSPRRRGTPFSAR